MRRALRRADLDPVVRTQVEVDRAAGLPGGGIEDRGGMGLPNLEKQTNRLISKLRDDRRLIAVTTQFRASTPQLFMDLNSNSRAKT